MWRHEDRGDAVLFQRLLRAVSFWKAWPSGEDLPLGQASEQGALSNGYLRQKIT